MFLATTVSGRPRRINRILHPVARVARSLSYLSRPREAPAWAPIPELSLTARDIVERVWQYGRVGGTPHGNYVRLFADKRTGGCLGNGVARWTCDGASLDLYDARGDRVMQFDRAEYHPTRGFRLLGHSLHPRDSGPRALTEYASAGQLSSRPVTLDWRATPRPAQRKNLVLIGANEQSLHHQWPREIADAERSWDLGVIFYGRAENYPPPGPCEFSVRLPKSSKFPALHAVLHAGSALWAYERIWIPDDDIMMSWSDITRMFDICRHHHLVLAQPALTPDSFVAHPITRRHPGSELRFVRFVEGMAPVFHRDALRVAVSTFANVEVGWGLDHVWPKLLGEPADGLAIIDRVAMTHTRPVAGRYSAIRAAWEMSRLLASYGVIEDFSELAIVPQDGPVAS